MKFIKKNKVFFLQNFYSLHTINNSYINDIFLDSIKLYRRYGSYTFFHDIGNIANFFGNIIYFIYTEYGTLCFGNLLSIE
jgi:hypothetical protein